MPRLSVLLLVLLLAAAGVLGATSAPEPTGADEQGAAVGGDGRGDVSPAGPAAQAGSAGLQGLAVTRAEAPARSIVADADGAWVATFTDGARTVALAGPERRFDEATATQGVTTDVWVRVLPAPFDGQIDAAWLEAARDDRSPDVLEVATQFFRGAPDLVGEDGRLLATDAGYGPLLADGTRPVGSDWHDFQGVTTVYGDIVDVPDPSQYRSLDCSGYVRMVFGVRFGVPLTLRPDGGASLPRRSFEQAAAGPGVAPVPDGGQRVAGALATDPAGKAPGLLQAGDLVFFDAPSDDDGRIDHVGIYLGVDDAGHHRFVHSRRSHNGPTMGGDGAGPPSLLDDDGFFARGFRATRRL